VINVRTNGRTCVCGYSIETNKRILCSNNFFEIPTIGIGSGIVESSPDISIGIVLGAFKGIGRRKICNQSMTIPFYL